MLSNDSFNVISTNRLIVNDNSAIPDGVYGREDSLWTPYHGAEDRQLDQLAATQNRCVSRPKYPLLTRGVVFFNDLPKSRGYHYVYGIRSRENIVINVFLVGVADRQPRFGVDPRF
jgi:hypothetical protein